jgi:hypothetical protein
MRGSSVSIMILIPANALSIHFVHAELRNGEIFANPRVPMQALGDRQLNLTLAAATDDLMRSASVLGCRVFKIRHPLSRRFFIDSRRCRITHQLFPNDRPRFASS